MSIIRKSITWTEQINRWVQSVVAEGEYTNESEYIRDLIRHDWEKRKNESVLKQAIIEGIDSGVSDKSIMDVWNEAEVKYKKNNG